MFKKRHNSGVHKVILPFAGVLATVLRPWPGGSAGVRRSRVIGCSYAYGYTSFGPACAMLTDVTRTRPTCKRIRVTPLGA
jgi:hypothetical protein